MKNIDREILTFVGLNGCEIRSFFDDDCKPWFISSDIVRALLSKNKTDVKKITKHYKYMTILLNNMKTNVLCVNERGLYEVIANTNSPKSESFKDWVFGDILPEIRKHGMYLTKQRWTEKVDAVEKLIKGEEIDVEDILGKGISLKHAFDKSTYDNDEHYAKLLNMLAAKRNCDPRDLDYNKYMQSARKNPINVVAYGGLDLRFDPEYHKGRSIANAILKQATDILIDYYLDRNDQKSLTKLANECDVLDENFASAADHLNEIILPWLLKENII